jgi:hypothetical protein
MMALYLKTHTIPANGWLPEMTYTEYQLEAKYGMLSYTTCSNGDQWLEIGDHSFDIDNQDKADFVDFLKEIIKVVSSP